MGRLLRARFDLPPEALRSLQERWRQVELTVLEELSEVVVQVESLVEFERRLSQLEAAAQDRE